MYIYVYLADLSVIRRDGFAAREAREAKTGTSRSSREELGTQNEKRTGHISRDARYDECLLGERKNFTKNIAVVTLKRDLSYSSISSQK